MSGQPIRIILMVILAIAILVLSILPEPPISLVSFAGMDKVQHWIAYTVLGFLVFLTLRTRGGNKALYLALTVFACSMYGGLIEVLQGFTGRTPEIADFFVNMLGSACGAIAALGFIEISRSRGKKDRSH